MKVVVTDYQYESIEQERRIIEGSGFSLFEYQKKKPEELYDIVTDADAVITQYSEIDETVIERMKNCKMIIKYGIGVNNIDVSAASKKGIAVCNVPDYGIEEVSDHAVTMILALAKKLAIITKAFQKGDWGYTSIVPIGRFKNAVVGLVGFGRIPQLVARKLIGFGVRILVYDPFCDEKIIDEYGVNQVSLNELCIESDYISLHCPLTEDTKHMINKEFLKSMKKTAYIVNTSRGPVINEDDLINALNAGEIAGAGLDVFEDEPLSNEHAFLHMEQVIATPHCAWYSEESIQNLQRKVAEEVVNVLKGNKAFNCVNNKELN